MGGPLLGPEKYERINHCSKKILYLIRGNRHHLNVIIFQNVTRLVQQAQHGDRLQHIQENVHMFSSDAVNWCEGDVLQN